MRRQRVLITKNFTDKDGTNSDYLLLFHHNISQGHIFTSMNDFLYSNTAMKYSIFGFLDDSYKFDGTVFEFYIEYPEQKSHAFWTQTINPLNAEHDSNIGYIDKGKNFKGTVGFTGLTKFNGTTSYLDGCNGDGYWYYGIGTRVIWCSENVMPESYSSTTYKIHEVFLWVRIPSLSFLASKRFSYLTCKTKENHLVYSPFVFIFWFSK